MVTEGGKGLQAGAGPGTGSRAGHWMVSEGAVAGEEAQGGQRDGVGCQHAWVSCGGPCCTSRLNKMAGIELLGQKYFTWGTSGGGGRKTHLCALQGKGTECRARLVRV